MVDTHSGNNPPNDAQMYRKYSSSTGPIAGGAAPKEEKEVFGCARRKTRGGGNRIKGQWPCLVGERLTALRKPFIAIDRDHTARGEKPMRLSLANCAAFQGFGMQIRAGHATSGAGKGARLEAGYMENKGL